MIHVVALLCAIVTDLLVVGGDEAACAAAAIFERLVGAEAGRLRVLRGYEAREVVKEGERIAGVRFSRGLEVRAKLTVDASETRGGCVHFNIEN